MLIIYDLDRTSIFCPIADWLDKFIPKNEIIKKLYYNLYPIAYIVEYIFSLVQVNRNMYNRAYMYDKIDECFQIVVTARHFSKPVIWHLKSIFSELSGKIPVVCIAQGLTQLHKYEIVKSVINNLDMTQDEEIIMYDDNVIELALMQQNFQNCKCIKISFKDNIEKICS